MEANDDRPGDPAAGLTYAGAGATREDGVPGRPPGFGLLRVRTRIGAGREVFRAAGRAVLTWRMHRAMGVEMATGSPRAEPGVRVVVGLGAGRLRIHAPCRVVWAADGERRAGFGYGTLPGHPERGEEAFVVELDEDGAVWLEVRAFSRPEVWWARAAGPLVPLFQRLYARRCGAVLRRLSRAGGDPRA
ncbi:DUF1990 domain-containing protein [Streptomyces verrucosisporus]|uniref:DUF1990 family protein n=1 Tax=Streptomyces verrucosisporus TaxID=1695161 RepID=UPI0019CF8914|nr:DUF1990 domain-containing protein [Streptomyces verrucosisporus]MBN3931283.1 DUF1990 domain-containing protein [Streptomyces verrucosisporus]